MVYRVFTTNGSKCIRKFESLEEAQVWCWVKDVDHGYRIEWQYEGESKPRTLYA